MKLLPRDNKSSCECEVTVDPGQSLPRGSSLSRVHVNRPLAKRTLQRRGEDIPRFVAERKKGKIAYFIVDKLVVRDRSKPPDRPTCGDGSDNQNDEVFINASRDVTECS